MKDCGGNTFDVLHNRSLKRGLIGPPANLAMGHKLFGLNIAIGKEDNSKEKGLHRLSDV